MIFGRKFKSTIIAKLAFFILIVGCGKQATIRPDGSLEVKGSNFIIHGVNWKDVDALPEKGIIRRNSHAVGNLVISKVPGVIHRCSAFLITPDIIMTNHHCVSTPAQARGAYIKFRHERGIPSSKQVKYSCDQFIDANERLDMAILRCKGRPGDRFGVLKLSSLPYQNIPLNEKIYVIHQNCNHEQTPSCDPTKKYSPGMITSRPSGLRPQLQFDADTLQGSSGAAVFSAKDHSVVALNNVGLYRSGQNGGIIPLANAGVAMSEIVKYLQKRHPKLPLRRVSSSLY